VGSLRSLRKEKQKEKRDPSLLIWLRGQLQACYQVSHDGCNWIDISKEEFCDKEAKSYPYIRVHLEKK